jgi:hypothetical protein
MRRRYDSIGRKFKNAEECDLSKSVKIGEQPDKRNADAFFQIEFRREKTIKDNKKMGPKFF